MKLHHNLKATHFGRFIFNEKTSYHCGSLSLYLKTHNTMFNNAHKIDTSINKNPSTFIEFIDSYNKSALVLKLESSYHLSNYYEFDKYKKNQKMEEFSSSIENLKLKDNTSNIKNNLIKSIELMLKSAFKKYSNQAYIDFLEEFEEINGYKEIINKNSTWKSLNVNNTKEHITSDIIIDINNSYYLLKLSQNRLIDNNCYSYQEPKIIKLIAFDGHM